MELNVTGRALLWLMHSRFDSCITSLLSLQVISVGRERYTVGEALFEPSLVGLDAGGIAEAAFRSIMAGPQENQRQFLENLVLCGGSSLITGKGN